MQKAKILAVAPYEGMADIITQIAQKRNDISLTVQTGDLNTGKEIAMQLAHKNYDVIISRGGTAELIRSAVEVPVIDISISVYDVLRSIKLAENYAGRFVIAGFSGITSCAHLLCDLLQYDIDIITFSTKEDAIPLLTKARESGCSLVLCDMIGTKAAQELGLNSILISSGTESIGHAIDEAVKLVHSTLHVHKQKDLFQSLLTEDDREFLIYAPSGSLWFSSIAIDEMNISLMNMIQTYLKFFFKVPNQTIVKQIREDLYTLSNRHLIYEGQKYTAITIKKQRALTKDTDESIVISNHLQSDSSDVLHYYGDSQKNRTISKMIEEYSKSHIPVLITGENGTGKDKAARLIYEKGPYENAPLFTINCALMGERKWNSLINNEDSPLNSVHSTIYLKNPAALSKDQLDSLFQYIDHTNLCKRSRLIISLIENDDTDSKLPAIRSYMENHLSCLTLKLPPLRECFNEFSSITALYIHRLNVYMGKQIIGFDTDAMEQLMTYHWPRNLDQLQHILKELIIITQTPYISCDDVKHILCQEPDFNLPATSPCQDLSGTLDEINYKIVQMVLSEENGNKERTASRLGISRSTLWRMQKNFQKS